MTLKFSIITVVYNGANTVESAIQSVINQTYDNIEYIIIDGGSNDSTMEIVDKYRCHFEIVVSEKDQGVYDGMNKGIGLATGDVICFLNADDIYVDVNVIELVAKEMEALNADVCYADLVYVKSDDINTTVRYWKSGNFNILNLRSGWVPPHPAFFARSSLFMKYGLFDLKYRFAADYDLMTRFISQDVIRLVYVPKVLVKMRLGGMTNRNISNILRQNLEILHSSRKNGISTSLIRLGINKLFRRGFEFINRPT
jgi:glycosyltransferase involved in cell wall biosynthesis